MESISFSQILGSHGSCDTCGGNMGGWEGSHGESVMCRGSCEACGGNVGGWEGSHGESVMCQY